MRPRSIAILGVAAYLAFLAATAPARWALARVELPPGVALSGVRGTIWNGSAKVGLASHAPAQELADVRWHFLPARLLSARLAYDITASGPAMEARAEVARGFGGMEARNMAARGDAAHLAALAPLLSAWRPQGGITLDAPAIAWDGSTLRGELRARWQDAALAISDVRPLGSYALVLRAEGGPARFEVTTLQGPLRIAGRGTFSAPGALAFAGEARADASAAAALAPLLDLLGPRRADGARGLDWRIVSPPVPSRS